MGFNPLCSEGMLKLQSVEGKDDDSGCHPALRADIVVAIVAQAGTVLSCQKTVACAVIVAPLSSALLILARTLSFRSLF